MFFFLPQPLPLLPAEHHLVPFVHNKLIIVMVSCLSSSSSSSIHPSIHPLLRVEFIYIENLSRSNSRISLLVCCLVSAVFFVRGNEMERERENNEIGSAILAAAAVWQPPTAPSDSINHFSTLFFSPFEEEEEEEGETRKCISSSNQNSGGEKWSFPTIFLLLLLASITCSEQQQRIQYLSTDAVIFDSVTSVFNILKYTKLRHRTDRWIDKTGSGVMQFLLRSAAAAAVAIECRGWSDLRIIDRRCCINKALEHQSLLCSHAALFYIFLNICTKGLRLKEEAEEGIVYVKYRRVIIVVVQGEQQQQQQRQQRGMEWNIVKPSEKGASDEVRRRASSLTPRIL